MPQKIVAKFHVKSVTEYGNGHKQVHLGAIQDGNSPFTEATPWGELKMQIDADAEAIDAFAPGEEYELTFVRS